MEKSDSGQFRDNFCHPFRLHIASKTFYNQQKCNEKAEKNNWKISPKNDSEKRHESNGNRLKPSQDCVKNGLEREQVSEHAKTLFLQKVLKSFWRTIKGTEFKHKSVTQTAEIKQKVIQNGPNDARRTRFSPKLYTKACGATARSKTCRTLTGGWTVGAPPPPPPPIPPPKKEKIRKSLSCRGGHHRTPP